MERDGGWGWGGRRHTYDTHDTVSDRIALYLHIEGLNNFVEEQCSWMCFNDQGHVVVFELLIVQQVVTNLNGYFTRFLD